MKAARRLHAPVRVDQYAQRTCGGHLLALKEVRRQILRDLAADKLGRADVRLLEPYVAADGQHTVAPDRAADIELSVRTQRQVDRGIRHVPAHIPRRVRHGNDAADRTAAVYAYGERAALLLHHLAEHGRGAERPPKSRGGSGGAAVYLPRALHGVPRRYYRHFYEAVSGCCTYYLIHQSFPRFDIMNCRPAAPCGPSRRSAVSVKPSRSMSVRSASNV